MAVAVVVMIVAALLLYMVAPGHARSRVKQWQGTSFAHRGLHSEHVCENTLDAFEHACRAGCGIELDVQLTGDGEVVVFHDSDLERMTGDSVKIAELTLQELRKYPLPDGNYIPSFREVLSLVDGRAPLLVELKNGGRMNELCKRTLEQLRGYRGRFLVESFQPLILLWFRIHAKDIIRGQLVAAREEYLEDYNGFVAGVMTSLVCNILARPDFISYDIKEPNTFALKIQRKLFHTPMAAWVVRDQKDSSAIIRSGEMPIFEEFIPDKSFGTKEEDHHEL